MTKRHWKQFEAECARLIGGKRYWSNSGERLDVESPHAIGQCKLVKNLSHAALSKLVEEMHEEGSRKNKLGVVLHKVPGGRGNKTIPMITMSFVQFDEWFSLRTRDANQ